MTEFIQDTFKVRQEGNDGFDGENIFEKNTFISREEIVQSSILSAVELKVSEKDIPNPEYFQEISEIRNLIEIIISNEELLAKFIDLEDSFEFHINYLPGLVKDIISRSETKNKKDLAGTLKSVLESSDFRNVGFYVENNKDENLYKAICEYADAYFQTKDLLKSVHRAKKVIETYFPDFYKEFPFYVSVLRTGDEGGASHSIAEDNEQNKRYLLRLEVLESRGNQRDYDDMETTGVFEKGYNFRCRISDLVSMIHEYAHGLYSEIIGVEENKRAGDYYETADSMVNEGFAVFIELKCCEEMINNAQEMGLDKRDVQDLQERRDQRMRNLEKYKYDESGNDSLGAYVEGMKVMNMLHEKGGVKNIKEFLEDINVEKTLNISRSSQEYKDALCDEEKLRSLFK